MYLGIDIGSVSTEAVLIDAENKLLAYSITNSGYDHKSAIQKVINEVCLKLNITQDDIHNIVSTGYGRHNVSNVTKTITEISCHAMGTHILFNGVKTVIDIGGQDSKIVRLTDDGFVDEFMMNDKCAAGTGRFLEVMAYAMNLKIEDLGTLSAQAKNIEKISSICTVFAESEVISKIADGCSVSDILAGIHNAIGERIVGMAKSVGYESKVAITGGVAKNSGVVEAIKRHLNEELMIPGEPQIIGAYGAAIFAKNS